MRIAVFSTKPYDEHFLLEANRNYNHELIFLEPRLTTKTVTLAEGCPAVCVFVNDELNADVLEKLSEQGTCLIALRAAGFNNVDLVTADRLGMTVVRVPAYSPDAVAEHTVGLMLVLNRKIHRSYARVREGNFALEGLLGFDMHGRTVGVIGTGKIGRIVARILVGFGCHILAYDPYPHAEIEEMGGRYVDLPELLTQSDIITLHVPLTPETHHLINATAISQMKRGVMVINTSRGALLDTEVIIEALKSGQVGYLGLDVYEEESDLFFEDLSNTVIQDDVFARLLTFPNVIVTGHQAFFTETAIRAIAETTLANVSEWERLGGCAAEVTIDLKNVVTTKHQG
ncbi:MAG: 2-hydroxyacid dehydrogenase [Anaerolineae bacterium]|nr:2-hydroxyacid dehydrogenase [Anaerolineae bacterium]